MCRIAALGRGNESQPRVGVAFPHWLSKSTSKTVGFAEARDASQTDTPLISESSEHVEWLGNGFQGRMLPPEINQLGRRLLR